MRKLSILAFVLTLAAGVAQAATQYKGEDIFVKGDGGVFDVNWGDDAHTKLNDAATSGDLVTDDGIFTCQITFTKGTVGNAYEFKVATSDWNPEAPANNGRFFLPASKTVTFYFDSNAKGDGYKPEPGSGFEAIVYTDAPARPIQLGQTLRVVGDFIDELGGAEWNATDDHGLMYDDGTHGDSASGDGIYTFKYIGLSGGEKKFKIVANGDWNRSIASNGYATNGDIAFTVVSTTDEVTILANIATGRYKAAAANPLLVPGPPFYACGVQRGDQPDAPKNIPWSDQISTTDTKLFDDGTHGDLASGDGIYSRVFDGPTTPGQYLIQVKQGVGQSYPDSGQYPIFTTYANQPVFVQFDTNTFADTTAKPDSRVVWVNPFARFLPSPAYVQAVGDFMMDYGAAGNWSNKDILFQMSDDGPAGANGDLTAGDGIYTFKLPAAPAALTGKAVKAVGKYDSWTYQFGGTGEGYTTFGNNDPAPTFSAAMGEVVFIQADTVTGRVGANVGAAPAVLQRPSTINTSSEVSDWTLLQ